MEIQLKNEQYENLIKLVYLGNWMINAIRSGEEGDENIEQYDDIAQYLYSFAKEAGLEEYIEYDQKFNKFFPTRIFEEKTDVEQYREDYDNEVFWEDLINRLSWRDFVRAYGEENVEKMGWEERFEKQYPFEEKYRKEVEENGIERLGIREEWSIAV